MQDPRDFELPFIFQLLKPGLDLRAQLFKHGTSHADLGIALDRQAGQSIAPAYDRVLRLGSKITNDLSDGHGPPGKRTGQRALTMNPV